MKRDSNIYGLSVIVPAYNVESYIDRCIESLEKQGDILYQIIVVNDGSTDTTLSHIMALKQKYTNIVILNQNNQGLFRARINGIKLVKTEWVTFCDSDDYIEEQFYEKVLGKIENDSIDIIEFGFQKIENGKIKYRFNPQFETVKAEEAIRRIIEKDNSSSSNCNKIYKTTLFQKIVFNENIRCYEEDKYINVKLMCESDLIMYLPEIGYNYETRIGSITTQKIGNTYYKVLDVNKLLYNYVKVKKKQISKMVGYDYCAHLVYCYIYSYKMTEKKEINKKRKELNEEYKRVFKNEDLKKYRPRKETIKRYCMMRLFQISPWLTGVIGKLIGIL